MAEKRYLVHLLAAAQEEGEGGDQREGGGLGGGVGGEGEVVKSGVDWRGREAAVEARGGDEGA